MLNSWVFICSSSLPQAQLGVEKIRVYEISGVKAMPFCNFFRRDKPLTAVIPNSKIGKVREVQHEKESLTLNNVFIVTAIKAMTEKSKYI